LLNESYRGGDESYKSSDNLSNEFMVPMDEGWIEVGPNCVRD